MQEAKDQQVGEGADEDHVHEPQLHDDANADADRKDANYRDDVADFAASSNYAKGQPAGHYDGSGPDTSSELVRERGSQDWQQGSAPPTEAAPTPAPSDGAVKSRSADPGQSSYGGFKDEGAVPEDVQHEQAAALRNEQEPRAADDGTKDGER